MEELRQHWSCRKQCWICGRTESEVNDELMSEFFEEVGAVSINLESVDALDFDMPVCVVCRELFRSMGKLDYSSYDERIDDPLLPEGSADELALEYAQVAERQMGFLSADLVRYNQSLCDNGPRRTAEQQANISLADLEVIMRKLQKVGQGLLKMRDGDVEPPQEPS